MDGSDTILYNFNNIITVDDYCFRTDLGSWTGRPVLMKDNGDTYFFNYFNDSILIRTQAVINESWVCYKWADKRKIVARVTAIKADTILGIVDSIKIIELQSVDSLGKQISHAINGWQLKLGKNHGFVSMPSFMVFPDFGNGGFYIYHPNLSPYHLIGFTNPETGTTNLTWNKIYDYNPGDEIHTSTYYQGGDQRYTCVISEDSKEIFKVLARQEKNDTIVYLIELRRQNFGISSVDTINYYVSDNPDFSLLPGEIVDEGYMYNEFTMLNNSKSKPYSFNWITSNGEDSCKDLLMVDDCSVIYTYYKGLGGPYYDAFNCPFSLCELFNHKLLYYKKGDLTWGTPLIITENIDCKVKNPEISVFPNPAKDNITVQILKVEKKCLLEIWSTNGTKISEHILSNQSSIIDISSLSKGIYFLKIKNGDKIRVIKLLVN